MHKIIVRIPLKPFSIRSVREWKESYSFIAKLDRLWKSVILVYSEFGIPILEQYKKKMSF